MQGFQNNMRVAQGRRSEEKASEQEGEKIARRKKQEGKSKKRESEFLLPGYLASLLSRSLAIWLPCYLAPLLSRSLAIFVFCLFLFHYSLT